MTQFGSDVVDAVVPKLTSSVTAKEGVSGPSALGAVADVFGGVKDVLIEDKKSKDEAKTKKILTDFRNKQLLIAQAVEQGKYSSSVGRSMARKNFIEFSNNYEGISNEIFKEHKNILGTAGLGKVIDTGTDAEKMLQSQNEALVREGLVDARASEQEFEEARNKMRKSLEAKRNYDLELQNINLQKAKTGLSKSNLELLEKQESRASYNYLTGISEVGYESFKVSMDNLVSKASSGEFPSANIVAEINNQFMSIQQEFAVPLSRLSSTQATALMKPFETAKQVAIDLASGKISKEIAENKFKTALNLNKSLAMGDERIARAAGLSAIFPSDPILIELSTTTAVADFLGVNSQKKPEEVKSPFSVTKDNRRGFKGYVEGLNRASKSKDMTPEMDNEINNHIENIMDGVGDYEGFIKKNPDGAIELMNWIGTQDFLKMRTERVEAFKNIDNAKQVISEHYSNEVWGMVQEEFKNSTVTIVNEEERKIGALVSDPSQPKGQMATPAGIDVVSTPNSETVNVDEEGNVVFEANGKGGELVSEAKRLNKTLAPIINKTVRAMAHLDGKSNYKAYSTKALSQILGTEIASPTDGEEVLDIEDFQEVPQISNESGRLSFLIDKEEGAGDYSTLFGFSQKSGRQFSNINVSEMTVGEAIDFSSPSGAYGKWVKTKVGRIATPMGRYQIVGTTLRGLVKEMGLPLDTKFDKSTQDAMFKHLVERRIGGKSDMASKIKALRAEWEGFRHVSDADLVMAIQEYEGSL